MSFSLPAKVLTVADRLQTVELPNSSHSDRPYHFDQGITFSLALAQSRP